MILNEFYHHFLTVANQVLILFLLVSLGYICGKKKIISETAAEGFSSIALYFSTPAAIICSFIRPFEKAKLTNLGFAFLISIVFHLVAIGFSFLIKQKTQDEEKVSRFALIFSNAGFMAIPLQLALFNADGAFYGSAYVVIFNVMIWTVGLVIMGGKLTLKKLLLNPGTIGVCIGLIIFLSNIHQVLPSSATTTAQHIANLNTPVPMIVIGYYLSKLDLVKAIVDKRIYFPLFLRLVVCPAICILLLWIVKMDSEVAVPLIVAAACPVAASTTMFTVKFSRDVDLSVKLVSVTTLFSIITLPLCVALTQVIL